MRNGRFTPYIIGATTGSFAAELLFLSGHPASLGAALSVLTVAGGTGAAIGLGRAADDRYASPSLASWCCLALAVVFGAFLWLRTSGWLTPFNALAASGLIVCACGPAALGRPRAGFASLGNNLLRVVPHWVAEPLHLGRSAYRRVSSTDLRGRLSDGSVLAVSRGLAITAPLVLVVGALMLSADEVFASYLPGEIDLEGPLQHVLVVCAGAIGVLGTLRYRASSIASVRLAAASPARAEVQALPARQARQKGVGTVEASIVLSTFAVLYLLFSVSQVATALAGSNYVLRRSGLTYAEWARHGYFQLLWAAGITLVVLLSLRRTVTTSIGAARAVLISSSLATVAFTLVVLASALRRLGLYSHEYGLTMLRLYSTVFGGLVAAVYLLVAIHLTTATNKTHRLVPDDALAPTAALLALLTLLTLNVINPEALVARSIISRGAKADIAALARLSADAVPTIVARVDRLTPDQQRDLAMRRRCRPAHDQHGLGTNRAARQAERAWASWCAVRG